MFSVLLFLIGYVFTSGKKIVKRWHWRTDVLRMIMPPAAFVLWTMLQRPTAFDATWFAQHVSASSRLPFAVAGAVVVGAIAKWLANRADEQQPTA